MLIDTDGAERYRFTSIELKQTGFRLDGVFLPKRLADMIYFLEVQFQRDKFFYARLFAEIFLYLYQYKPKNDWVAAVVYPSRSREVEPTGVYAELIRARVKRVYLDELVADSQNNIGASVLKLIIEPEKSAISTAATLLRQVERQVQGEEERRQLLEFIKTIVIYKFPKLTREEIEAMLDIPAIKHTRVYKDAVAEGLAKGRAQAEVAKKQAVLKLFKRGMAANDIADVLDMPLADVKKITQEKKKKK